MNVIGVVPIVVLTVILTVAVITDIRLYRIPNWLTFPSMLFGICYHTYTNGFYGAVVCKLAEEINRQAVFLCTCGVFNVYKMAY